MKIITSYEYEKRKQILVPPPLWPGRVRTSYLIFCMMRGRAARYKAGGCSRTENSTLREVKGPYKQTTLDIGSGL